MPSPNSRRQPSWASSWKPGFHSRSSLRGGLPNKQFHFALHDPCGRASPAWAEERSHRHVCIVSAWANSGHAWCASCIGETEAAAHLFLGPSCNWGLGRTGANRCRREQVQPDSRVSIAEQLLDGCRREAMDNHRSRPVCNHSVVTR
jgi:hypothetical protein